ncbi:hypothetical protein EGW08_023089 [Elysia chlorotica]|uniref:BSD domain-containing protein n=1 Tax=Elysia chlorotica TaxID=188477 RepID=A0A3S1B0T8_ELYCH|nr:hypothetical protein EGW08_023089 [Elysia chlorotica]
MAEGGSNTSGEGESWENWFGGWMQTAKEKSQTALEFVKKDLAEFGCTVQKETEKAVELTKGSLHSDSTTEATKKVKAGLASFLDNISKVLVVPPDEDNYIPMKVAADGSGLYDRGKARLHALQLDAGTYMDPPRGAPEQYSMWLESFSLDQHKGEISELLVSKVEVRALYTKLVPSEVSNADFWQRYFYRVHQLQCDEARKQALMMRADQAGGKESVSWDDDDEDEECGDDDDGNHSDWEKMPRPPQSYVSQPKTEAVKQGYTEESTAASNKEGSTPKSTNVTDHQTSTVSSRLSDEAQENLPTDASVSANAVEPNLKTTQSTSVCSQNVDASGESTEWSPVEALANPWSLHIPEDLASASDAAETEAAEERPSEPTRDLPIAQNNEGSAAGAEVVPQESSSDFPADGACGAVDVAQDQAESQSAEVPTAGSAESIQPTPESSTQKARSEAITPKQPSPPPEPKTTGEASSDTVLEKSEEEKVEMPEVEKQKDTCSESDPQRVVNDAAKNTDFKPVSEDNKGSLEKGEDTVSTQAAGGEAGAHTEKEIGMRVKGDMVVVGDRDSPSSTESSDTKDLGLGEDWEQDFDVEITEEDLKAAEDIAKRLGENLDENDDDWENWE